MRRWVVLAGAVAVAGVTGPAVAQAPPDAPLVRAEAWYWRSQAPSAAPPAPAPDPAGHLMVAAAAGRWEKVALVRLELGSAAPASLELTFDAPADEAASDVDADAAEIRACLVGDEWDPAHGGAWDRLPSIDCSLAQPGTLTGAAADRTLAFDLGVFAERWSAGTPNHGVAVVPAVGEPPRPGDPPAGPPPGSGPTWQIGLHGLALGGIHVQSASAPTATPPAAPSQPAPSGSPRPPATVVGGVGPPVVVAAPRAPATAGRSPAATAPLGRALPALAALDRSQQTAAGWAAALVVATGLALAAARSRGGARLRRAAVALVLGAVLAGALALDGVREQGALQWQLPYAASGGLAAVVLLGASTTLFAASVLDDRAARRRQRTGPGAR